MRAFFEQRLAALLVAREQFRVSERGIDARERGLRLLHLGFGGFELALQRVLGLLRLGLGALHERFDSRRRVVARTVRSSDELAIIFEVAVILARTAVIDEPQAIRARLGQIDIVRDQQYRAFVLVNRVDQGFAAIDVQVRGWFVEDQNVRLGVRHQAEEQAHFFAAAQVLNLSVDLFLTKAHARRE